MPTLILSTEVWTLLEHEWPDAPPHRSYLSIRHPHTFHFVVELAREAESVGPTERPVELHDLRDSLAERVRLMGDPEDWSCEGMAVYIAAHLARDYDGWEVAVGVYEEGMTGARVMW